MTAIDISRYQGAVDFLAVEAANEVGIAVAKMGGGDAGVYVDARWVANRDGIRAAGIRLGSYFFNGPGDTPTQAADFQFANIDWRPGDYVVIDVEGHGIAYSPAQAYEWAARMLTHGVPASDLLIYMSRSVENGQDFSQIKDLGVGLWVADYGTNTGQPGTPPRTVNWPSWALWQYTSNGSVPGISGRVDVSQLAPGWSGGNITPLEDEVTYTIIAASDAPLLNTLVYLGWPAPFVLSGDTQDALAQKESIAAWNGVDNATLEANIKPMSSVAVRNAINRIPGSSSVDVIALANALAPLVPHLDQATILSTVTTAVAGAVKPTDLTLVLAAIAALNTSDTGYLQQIEAILAKGLSGTVTVTPK